MPTPAAMVKNSFFLRHACSPIPNSNTYFQNEFDIGAFVDALGESLLRIHAISVQYTDVLGNALDMDVGPNASAHNRWQLTTQTQSDMVKITDKSIIASGALFAANSMTGVIPTNIVDTLDVGPNLWANGYLVAVETLFMGSRATTEWAEAVSVNIVLECTVERATKEAALALAMSQQ